MAQRERCRLEDWAPPPNPEDAVDMAAIIPRLMKRLGIEEEHWLSVLDEDWSKIVGEEVAKHTRPGRVLKKSLIVFVDSSVWLSELVRFGRKEMLANLHKRFGEKKIKSLSFQLDPDGGR